MLPQFGFTEFLLVAIIALIVVGPKDLPLMMRKLGQLVAKGKAMAREFQSAFDDIARQAELDELRQEIEDLRRDNALSDAVDELKKTEADINRKVMMQKPVPGAGQEDEAGKLPADREAPTRDTAELPSDAPEPSETPSRSAKPSAKATSSPPNKPAPSKADKTADT